MEIIVKSDHIMVSWLLEGVRWHGCIDGTVAGNYGWSKIFKLEAKNYVDHELDP